MKLIGTKDDFAVWFCANSQSYTVTKSNKFFIGNKYKFSDVKSYLD